MSPLVQRDDVAVYHATDEQLRGHVIDTVGGADLLCVDAPYSERTHGSYREMPEMRRQAISYDHWGAAQVRRFVDSWAPQVGGWFCTLTDHILAPIWEDALAETGRYVFSPIACVEPGSRVRISGDGPAQWSCQLIVARPRDGVWLGAWQESRRRAGLNCSLPGAYVVPSGSNRAREGHLPGGKPLWLMERIVEDYSLPGDLVCDPCCGGGTTLHAALTTGRRAIGGDAKLEHAQLSAARVDRMVQRPLFAGLAS